MSGIGITYLWLSKKFPPFVRLEDKRGDYEVYTPERTCTNDGTIKWDWDRSEPYWQHELSCGHVVTTLEPEPPRFCEECGAKVVD